MLWFWSHCYGDYLRGSLGLIRKPSWLSSMKEWSCRIWFSQASEYCNDIRQPNLPCLFGVASPLGQLISAENFSLVMRGRRQHVTTSTFSKRNLNVPKTSVTCRQMIHFYLGLSLTVKGCFGFCIRKSEWHPLGIRLQCYGPEFEQPYTGRFM